MKKAKITKTNQKEKTKDFEESYSFKKLALIILVLILVFTIFYLITTLVVKPAKNVIPGNNAISEIDSTKIIINHLLDRNEDKYYVLATKASLYDSYTSRINYIEIYNKYITDYSSKEESLEFYTVDLDDALNKNYVGEQTNITSALEELKLSDETLFKINNGKIENYYVGSESIIKALSELN